MYRKSSPWIRILFLGAAAGLFAAWFLRRWRHRLEGLPQPTEGQAKKVLLFAVCQQMLAARRGPAQAKILLETVQREYADLCLDYPIPANQAMRMHLCEYILPEADRSVSSGPGDLPSFQEETI
jgi:hypothetical protein